MKKYIVYFAITLLISLPFLLYFKQIKITTFLLTSLILAIAIFGQIKMKKP